MSHTEAKDEQNFAMRQSRSELVFSDIVLWIHPLHVEHMVRALQEQIAAAGYPALVLWSGLSGRCKMGVVVVEWEGEIAPSFLQDLRCNVAVTDFVSYDWASAYRFHSEEEEEEPADETQLPLARFQTTLAYIRTHLDVIIDIQHVPQEQEIKALLQDFHALREIIAHLQPSSTLAISGIQGLPDRISPFEYEVVLLRETCQSEEQTLGCVLSRQCRVRAKGNAFFRYVEEVQKALEKNR